MTENKEKEMQLTVPYIAHEAAQARTERTIRRLIVALIVSIILLFATNVLWIWNNSQYDFVDGEVNVDTEGEGNANYIGQDGDIYNGTNYSQEKSKNQEIKQ